MDVNIIAVGDCSVRRFRRGERLSVSWSMLLLVGVSMWCPCIEGLFVRIYVGICAGDVQSVSRDSEFGAGVPRSDSPRYERVADETCPRLLVVVNFFFFKIGDSVEAENGSGGRGCCDYDCN